MPGLIGICSFGEGSEKWNVLRFTYYAMLALQNRGQEAFSIAWVDKATGSLRKVEASGNVEELLPLIDGSSGHVAIGMTSPLVSDHIVEVDGDVRVAVAMDGKTLDHRDRREACKAIGEELSSGSPLHESMLRVATKYRVGYSFLVLTEKGEVGCGRSAVGLKPLTIGSIGFDLGCVASESSALDVIGATYSSIVGAGEIITMTPLTLKRDRVIGATEEPCTFEFVYLARHDSVVFQEDVYRVREEVGKCLARGDEVDCDVVIGVPETSYPIALSYGATRRRAVKLGFVRSGDHIRSALKGSQLERLIGLQLKLNPVPSVVDGKNVVLIDDSIVRGNTLKNVISLLRRKGAVGVHVRIGSPQIVKTCPYGTEIPPRDELIAGNLRLEDIKKVIGCDSIEFLRLEDLERLISKDNVRPCTGCFGGRYAGDVKVD
ncbi:MAG: hypothetical protein NZ920_06310 [Aigarchaeota archaeon]|nr:hypothetical protein [Aigarchaeota archaeon]MDW8092720.1 hypothetical protein [Nitrososphaerota archaeon]